MDSSGNNPNDANVSSDRELPQRTSSVSTRDTSKTQEQDSKGDTPQNSKEDRKHTEKQSKETSRKPRIQDSIFISHANAPEGSGIPKHWPTEGENKETSTEQAQSANHKQTTNSLPRRSIKDSIIITHANAPRDSGIPRHWPDE